MFDELPLKMSTDMFSYTYYIHHFKSVVRVLSDNMDRQAPSLIKKMCDHDDYIEMHMSAKYEKEKKNWNEPLTAFWMILDDNNREKARTIIADMLYCDFEKDIVQRSDGIRSYEDIVRVSNMILNFIVNSHNNIDKVACRQACLGDVDQGEHLWYIWNTHCTRDGFDFMEFVLDSNDAAAATLILEYV